MLDGDNLRGMVSSSQSSPALEHLGLPTTCPPGRVSRGLPLAGPDTGSRARELDVVVEGHPKEPATPDSHQLGDPCCSCSLPAWPSAIPSARFERERWISSSCSIVFAAVAVFFALPSSSLALSLVRGARLARSCAYPRQTAASRPQGVSLLRGCRKQRQRGCLGATRKEDNLTQRRLGTGAGAQTLVRGDEFRELNRASHEPPSSFRGEGQSPACSSSPSSSSWNPLMDALRLASMAGWFAGTVGSRRPPSAALNQPLGSMVSVRLWVVLLTVISISCFCAARRLDAKLNGVALVPPSVVPPSVVPPSVVPPSVGPPSVIASAMVPSMMTDARFMAAMPALTPASVFLTGATTTLISSYVPAGTSPSNT